MRNCAAVYALSVHVYRRRSIDSQVFGQLGRRANLCLILFSHAGAESGLVELAQRGFLKGDTIQRGKAFFQIPIIAGDLVSMGMKVIHVSPVNIGALRRQAIGIHCSTSELVSTKPETIVYTLNPKAVWSDGVAITAADFKYAWEKQRGDPDGLRPPDVASIAGYRDIASVTGSNGGHTVTVKFKTTFADWQMLFANLVPAHVMEKTGWNPSCTTVNPAIDLSGGPVQDRVGDAADDHPRAEPQVVGDAGQCPLHHGPHRVVDGAAGPVDGVGLRAGGGAQHGDAVVPDPDDGAAGSAERGGHLGDAAAAGHGELARLGPVARPPGRPSR